MGDLTALWKALEADAARIDALVASLVKPDAPPAQGDLQAAIQGAGAG